MFANRRGLEQFLKLAEFQRMDQWVYYRGFYIKRQPASIEINFKKNIEIKCQSLGQTRVETFKWRDEQLARYIIESDVREFERCQDPAIKFHGGIGGGTSF